MKHPAASTGADAGRWIADRLHPFATDVGSVVPSGFEACVRVLHPAWRSDGGGKRVKVRWADLARPASITIHATTRFDDLAPADASGTVGAPETGTLERDELEVLIELLSRHTARSSACWFGIWEGYGWMTGHPSLAPLSPTPRPLGRRSDRGPRGRAPRAPRLELPHRPLVLYEGPITAATAYCEPPASQSPNLWWPRDRAWCVASEIDFRSTYVAATRAAAADILDDPRVEALAVEQSHHVTD